MLESGSLNLEIEPAMKKHLNEKDWIKRFWITYVCSLVFIAIFFVALSYGLLGFMPSFQDLENPKSNLASEVISADQKVLGGFFIENRSNIHYYELSPWVVKALVATEDARFEKHSGIDGKALMRVVFGMATNTDKGGGSTITQQLAKNLFPRQRYFTPVGTAFAKLREWVTAIKLERNFTKEEIAALYLNTVDFGSLSFGIKSAAKTYFGKTPSELNMQESALLIGILKAPSWFHPMRNKERATKRREVVLHQMMKYGYITENQYDSVKMLPLDMSHFTIQDHNTGPATYFREYLRMMLMAEKPVRSDYDEVADYIADSIRLERDLAYGWINKYRDSEGKSYNLYRDGLKIYTTINSRMQNYAEEAVAEHLSKDLQPAFNKHWKGNKHAPYDLSDKKEIDKLILASKRRSDRYISLKKAGVSNDSIDRSFSTPVPMRIFSWKGVIDTVMSPMDSIKYHKWFLQAGLMSMEPQTGYVRAYVGGINFKHFKYDHVVLGRRQVGSTFKPFVYTVAMQYGELSPCSQVPNVQVTIENNGTVWAPSNSSDYKEGQMVTLKEALANSINWISAYLIKRFSPQAVVQIARKMGIVSPLPAVPSICLGTPDISLYEMTGAVNTYANQGLYIQPIFITRIEDKHGNVIAEFAPRQEEAMSEETAYLMLGIMKGVVESGTGARLRGKYGLTNPIAGKTGTTQSNSDGWFMGLTPDLVTGVWVGGDDRSIRFRVTSLGQGANMALPIWALYMKKIYSDSQLQVSKGDFEPPEAPLSVDINCATFEEKSGEKINPAEDDRY
jgi:penicillin-binding protein 1A